MILITFSGLDGCGKTTQVRLACDLLARRGLRAYRLVTLFTSVAGALTLVREARKRRRVKAIPESSERQSPLRTYTGGRTFTEDRQRRRVRLQRWLAYPPDCLALSFWLLLVRWRGYDAVVCDRYIYDKMVNLPEPDGLLARLMRRLVPKPDCAVFLEVVPADAARRRVEHTPDYYLTKDAAYRRVLRMNVGLQAVPPGTLEQTQRRVEDLIRASIDATVCHLPAHRHRRPRQLRLTQLHAQGRDDPL